MKFVAFLRNVNLGQRGSPTRPQFESTFLPAGAETATSLLSNGTLVFTIPDGSLASKTAARAGAILRESCGWRERIFVRGCRQLAQLVEGDPFAEFAGVAVAERAITFFEPQDSVAVTAPIESVRKDCLVFRIDAGEAFSITRIVAGKTGYPTPVLESALKSPVTTRSWGTILRLVAKHGKGNT